MDFPQNSSSWLGGGGVKSFARNEVGGGGGRGPMGDGLKVGRFMTFLIYLLLYEYFCKTSQTLQILCLIFLMKRWNQKVFRIFCAPVTTRKLHQFPFHFFCTMITHVWESFCHFSGTGQRSPMPESKLPKQVRCMESLSP